MKLQNGAGAAPSLIGGGPAQEVREQARAHTRRPSGVYPTYLKPILDRLLGTLLLILTLPVLVVAALVVYVELGRPVFYRQPRVGWNGKEFELLKLRTMIPDRRRQPGTYDGPDRRLVHKSPEDPRVPTACRTIRALRLDELPQFWNVIKGDMSLVGPRPEMPEIVDKYEDWQHRRHVVRPGLTGPWQVSARNGKLMHECTDLDLDYVDRVTFGHDLNLLLRTPAAMLGRRKGF